MQETHESLTARVLAWMVHAITASGAVWGLLAVVAVFDARWPTAFAWLAVATLIDGFDGTLARRFRVKQVIPDFDGALLDNMIDYFTYVLVPALLILRAELVPAPLGGVTLALIALSSAYQFSQASAKTSDHFFTGFPSYWNVVALYLFLLNLPPTVNFTILAACGVLVFVPIKYIYPSRTRTLQRTTLTLSLLWAVGLVVILIQLPHPAPWLVSISALYLLYYVALSLFLTARGRVAARRGARTS